MMMIKASQKQQKLGLFYSNIRNITARRVVNQVSPEAEGRDKDMQDVQGALRGGVGIVRLNREHRFNTLTPNFIRQVSRGVESMCIDHSVQLVYLSPKKGQHFSNGTDFRTIMHYKANGQQEQLSEYLGNIFKLQATFAKSNKPIMTVAPGHSFNSGANLLIASGFPSICDDSQLSFNECTFGFVPHAGTTYYTSRLPGDFGTFLALTGVPLSGRDSIKVGLADAFVDVPKTYEHEITAIVTAMDPTCLPNARHARLADGPAAIGQINQVDDSVYQRAEAMRDNTNSDYSELQRRIGYNHHDEQFIDPRLRKPDIVAEADLGYEQILKNYDLAHNGEKGPGFFDHEAITHNFFQYTHQWLSIHAGHRYNEDQVKSLLKHKEMIDRCFFPNSVKEIMENLRLENHPFAKEVLQKMESNSMLSMELALKMQRKASNMGYGEILQMELNVALNKANDADFELGVKEILMKPARTSRLGARPNPGFQTEVSESLVDSYFEENKWASAIDLNIVENSLLPTRHFFRRFTDSVRVWINETSTPQEAVRVAVELEVTDALRAEGIDLRNKTVTIPMAREQLDKKVRAERRDAEFQRRANQLATDKKLRERYYDGINAEVKKLEEDPKVFYDLVNQNVQSIFEKAYLGRLSTMYQKSKEAQSLEKRRMFIRLKKFLIKERLLTYQAEETTRLAAQIAALPFKQLHMTEKWDVSHRDQEHPEIQQSVMWHLSKVVGKASLAPPEMIRSYLTNPDAAKSQRAYTFDKKELENLRRDLLENPEKYEELLLKEVEEDPGLPTTDPGRLWESRDARASTREYWHRVVNDGRAKQLDNWPMRVEYHAYKAWADQIQGKALDTLKYTVTRLLLDFEDNKEVGNTVVDFAPEAKEPKRKSLNRLLTLLNQRTANPVDDEPASVSKALLKSKTRSLNEIRKDFHSLIDKDADLQKFFGTKKTSRDNSLISSLRTELLQELFQLVEIVLLESKNKRGAPIRKDLLEKRLAETMAPQNAGKDHSAQLRIIDSFLAEKGSHANLKEAIRLVKPFFYSICSERLEQEATRILHGFRVSENGTEALEQYLFLQNYSGKLSKDQALQRYLTQHPVRDQMELLEKQKPEASRKQAERDLLDVLGIGIDTAEATTSIDEREKQLTENVREHQRGQSEVVQLSAYPEQAFAKHNEQRHKDELNLPFDQSLFDQRSAPEEDILALGNLEWEASQVREWVRKHHHELSTLMSSADWLQVYGEGIKKHGIDMDYLIRGTKHPDEYAQDLEQGQTQLSLLQAAFGGDESLTWHSLAEYATYLGGLFAGQNEAANASDYNENLEQMIEFMVGHSKDERSAKSSAGKSNLTRESIFQALTRKRYGAKNATRSEDAILNEMTSISELQNRLEKRSQLVLDCLRLSKFAPQEIKEEVEAMIGSQGKYLDLASLRQKLETRDFSKRFAAKDFLDQERLMRDVHDGTVLQDFMNEYRNLKLDVVSIAELKGIVRSAKPNQNIKASLIAEMKTVLDHVDDQMKHVSHERREQLTLGEFMTRHHYLNASTYKHYSSDLLRNQIESAIGRGETAEESAAAINGELGGVRTHPASQVSAENVDLNDQIFDVSEGSQLMGVGATAAGHVAYLNPESGEQSIVGSAELIHKAVYRDAQRLSELTPGMADVKNLYENRLLKEYTEEKFDQDKVEHLIQEYTQARLKDCMLKPDFATALRSPNASIYLKMLKEHVMSELKLNESASITEFDWGRLPAQGLEAALKYDPESRYNLNHLNNEQAIGYRNLENRAADIANNKDLAHETVFDKLLADYFLQKRGDYKKSNQVLTDLERLFSSEESQTMLYGDLPEDDPARTADATGPGQRGTLGAKYLRQTWSKEDDPELLPYNFPAMMELDIAVNRQLHNDTSGLSAELREMAGETPEIPEYFDLYDVRKPAGLYVRDKLQGILDELFESRRNLEKHLSRSELVAYDQVLAKYLQHDVLVTKLKREIYKDYNVLEQTNQMLSHSSEDERNQRKQAKKTRNSQPDFNRDVVNEDAFYKLLAFNGNLQKKRTNAGRAVYDDAAATAGFDSFVSYYQDELADDAKRPARPIDPEVFAPRLRSATKSTQDGGKSLGFLDLAGRRERFHDEHALYRENNLEQQERIELFYVLEQFFESSRQNPAAKENESLAKAQQHMQEYFSQPENTFFFDKNKIN